MTTKPALRATISILLAAFAVALVAACGSSASSGKTAAVAGTAGASAASTSAASRTKLVACLKSHGITLPNRPRGGRPAAGGFRNGKPPAGGFGHGKPPSGGSRHGRPPAGGFFGGGFNSARAHKLQAAFKACGADFPRRSGRPGGAPGRFRPTAAAVAKFSSCVAKHGYKLPKPDASGNGPIFPRSIESNKRFQAAAKACVSDLRPSGPPGGSSRTSTAPTA